MNYFAHALPHLNRPYFVAGTALPDWLSVVDRKIRLRPGLLVPHLHSDSAEHAELSSGALQHLHDDDWFHTTRAFAEVSATLGLLFRERLRGSDGFRCGFLGHIVTEMLMDSVLIRRFPGALEQYYETLNSIDPGFITDAVVAISGRTPDRLAWFVQLFRQERILDDYTEPSRLLRRLNQVLLRVKLSPLPDAASEWLAEAQVSVELRLEELLPSTEFAWPESSHPLAERSLP